MLYPVRLSDPVRRFLLLSLALTLSACDVVGLSESGEFEATVSGDITSSLSGTAISDVQEAGTTIILAAEGEGFGSQIRILVAPDQLTATTLPLGGDVASLTYLFPTDGGQIAFVAASGSLDLDGVDDGVDGRFTATAVSSGGSEVTVEGTFRAPSAITP